ncbi:DHHC-type zinc finger family protein [Striga asiatica]|uniref:DHHC-type zinc finger family protein n=1 Tax=Striga asiatica TaxID=4170 RepID=A0A5A7PMU5_STRAF|nr:DHHC-type zinc finger family protein [Striga asiatica]
MRKPQTSGSFGAELVEHRTENKQHLQVNNMFTMMTSLIQELYHCHKNANACGALKLAISKCKGLRAADGRRATGIGTDGEGIFSEDDERQGPSAADEDCYGDERIKCGGRLGIGTDGGQVRLELLLILGKTRVRKTSDGKGRVRRKAKAECGGRRLLRRRGA